MPELTSWDQTGLMAVLKISTFLYFYNDNLKKCSQKFPDYQIKN